VSFIVKSILSFCIIICCYYNSAAQLKNRGKQDSTARITYADTLPTDTSAQITTKKKEPYIHQLRFGVDVARVLFNALSSESAGYGVQADYLLRKDIFIAAQAGFGRGRVDYPVLKYNTDGFFLNIGLDKSLFDRRNEQDFDVVFIGLHYGLGIGNRQEASYRIASLFGKEYTGSIPSQNYTAHWGEVSAGIRVELWKYIFAGWNVNMRFLLNGGSFSDLAPNYIPGYGKGDQSVAVDFNFFVSYAIRWGGKARPH
jgi:hypothetical protein